MMNNTFQNVDILLRLPLFTVLGLAIFLAGCSYTYTHTQEFGSEIKTSNFQLREHIKFNWTSFPSVGLGKYTGIQDAQALMKALDDDYNRGHSKTEVSVSHTVGTKKISYSSHLTESEMDARYPRTEWFQMLLDKGITIEDFGAYSRYLLKRHTLALLEDNPNLRQSGIFDIPPTDNWKTYKALYIDKLVKDGVKDRKN